MGSGLCLKTLGFEQDRGCDAFCVDMQPQPPAVVTGTDGWVLDRNRQGRGLCARRPVCAHQHCPPTPGCPGTHGHLHCQGAGPPGAPLDPSLTQADRFLLVFRVCFCLAPFEIGYDVGGKAAASKPHTKCAQQQPVVSWKMDGQRVGRKVTLLLPNFFHCICDTLLQRQEIILWILKNKSL